MVVKEGDLLEKKIISIVKSSTLPISTQDICLKTSKPWHSIQMRCLRLQIAGKLNGFRVGRINLWQAI